MLGAEFAVERPKGLKALIIANSPAAMSTWISEANRLRADLPADVQAILLRHEEAGTTDSAEYMEQPMSSTSAMSAGSCLCLTR